MRLVFDDNRRLLCPWMLFEICANEAPILRPSVKRIAGAMYAEESPAAGDKVDDSGFLVVGEFQLTARQREEQHVVGGQARRVGHRQLLSAGHSEFARGA